MSGAYEKIPAPHVSGPGTEATFPEVLSSMHGLVTEGVYFAGGQGILDAGLLVDQDPATKLWGKAGEGDFGPGTAILLEGRDMGAPGSMNQQATVATSGTLKRSVVEAANGGTLPDLEALNGREVEALDTVVIG